MKFILKIILTVYLGISVGTFYAQESDSLQAINEAYRSILNEDSTFLETIFYKYSQNILINNLGPYGSYSYVPNSLETSLYGTFTKEPQGKHSPLFARKAIKPFTNLRFVNGGRKEQLFLVEHVQNFGKLFSLGFDYQRINSAGIYFNQESNVNELNAEGSYKSRNDNYRIRVTTNIDRIKNKENGGLVSSSDFESDKFGDKLGYAVNLSNSEVDVLEYNHGVNQRINLWKDYTDSTAYVSYFVNLSNTYKTRRRIFFDNDPLSTLYKDIFLDSVSSMDSIHQKTFSNTLSFGMERNNFSFSLLAAREDEMYFQQLGIDSTYGNTLAGLRMNGLGKKLMVSFFGSYFLSGYRNADVETKLEFNYILGNENQIDFSAIYTREEPTLRARKYYSNHFIWNNLFQKQSTMRIQSSWTMQKPRLKLSGSYRIVNNLLYFDTLALPNQSLSSQALLVVSIAKKYSFSRFHMETSASYQSTSNNQLLPMPDFVVRQLAYYENTLFKEALKLRVGLNLYYTSDYYGYNYMPATSQFYVQEEEKIGNYPYLDVFVSAHVKRAQFFIVYEHLNSGSSLNNAYTTPGYPILDRLLKIGISWNLFD